MPAQISLIVPTLNSEAELPECLSVLIEGLHLGLIRELIVTDGGSQDATLKIADSVGAEIVTGPASRGGQLGRGVAKARADWLLILHSDTILTPGWARSVASHLEQDDRPACFRLRFRAKGMMPAIVAAWANLRSRLFHLPYGDQGLLVRRSDYERAGGYADQPLMEDVHLVRALEKPVVVLDVVATTSAERYLRAGWLRRGARNLWTLVRYFAGADPAALASDYRK